MGLISRVSSRTYRYKNVGNTQKTDSHGNRRLREQSRSRHPRQSREHLIKRASHFPRTNRSRLPSKTDRATPSRTHFRISTTSTRRSESKTRRPRLFMFHQRPWYRFTFDFMWGSSENFITNLECTISASEPLRCAHRNGSSCNWSG